jgi:hypothetical protein
VLSLNQVIRADDLAWPCWMLPSGEQGSTEARFLRTVTSGPWASRFILTSEGPRMNELLGNDILFEDSACFVSYNSLGIQGPCATTTVLQRKTLVPVKRLQQFLRFQAK